MAHGPSLRNRRPGFFSDELVNGDHTQFAKQESLIEGERYYNPSTLDLDIARVEK